MKIEPFNHLLKNGEEIHIREARVDDAVEIINVIKEYAEESSYIPYVVGEFNPSIEEEEKWIQSFSEYDNNSLLLVIYKNCIVGNITLNASQRKMLKHTACIGIGLLKEMRGKGIGSVLFATAIEWARNNSILEYLWLETYHTNKIGLSLYEKYGFSEVGRESNFVKISATDYAYNVTMTLDVKQNN